MSKNEKIQLIASSAIMVWGIVYMIQSGSIELMFFFWVPVLWWVVMFTRFVTQKIPNRDMLVGRIIVVAVGVAIYFLTMHIVLPSVFNFFGIKVNFF